MKKLLSILLIMSMIFCLCSCGQKNLEEMDPGENDTEEREFELNSEYIDLQGSTKAEIDKKCDYGGKYSKETNLVDYKNGLKVSYDNNEGEKPDADDEAEKLYISFENLFFACPDILSEEQIKSLFKDTYVTLREDDEAKILVANCDGKELIFEIEPVFTNESYALLNDKDYNKTKSLAKDYETVIKDYYTAVATGNYNYEKGMTGLAEIVYDKGASEEDALRQIGYAVRDLSGDGRAELIIGISGSNRDVIFAIYSLKDEKPFLAFEGNKNNNCQLKSDNTFYYHNSVGDDGSSDGIYKLSEDGTSFTCVDNYFIAPYNDSTAFFHNKTGNVSVNSSEKLDITRKEYDELVKNTKKDTVLVGLIPFSDYI